MYVCAPCVYILEPLKQELQIICEPPHGCLEASPGPQPEQPMLLPAEPCLLSLQILIFSWTWGRGFVRGQKWALGPPRLVTSSCELPCVGAGNQTLVFYKNRVASLSQKLYFLIRTMWVSLRSRIWCLRQRQGYLSSASLTTKWLKMRISHSLIPGTATSS